MNQSTAKELVLSSSAYFDTTSEGYKTWGKVEVLKVAIRYDECFYILQNEQGIQESLSINDGSVYGNIFKSRSKINVILLTKQEFASKVKEVIPPILDDQAQLLGVNVKIASSESDASKALKGRFACNVANGTSVCIGNSLEDAYVAAQLLEKTSKAFVEAKFLGGAKSINIIEAWLMQQFYLLKYSKEAQKNK